MLQANKEAFPAKTDGHRILSDFWKYGNPSREIL
jgi:hypothetical protein